METDTFSSYEVVAPLILKLTLWFIVTFTLSHLCRAFGNLLFRSLNEPDVLSDNSENSLMIS